jgi:2-octaprenyl-6-methoxyphenol hydroxylase
MHDVAIIGAGPVGLAAAAAAVTHGLSALLLEAQDQPGGREARVFAVSHGARLILERLGAWDGIEIATPIQAVHVSQRGRLGRSVLHAHDLGLDALGYVLTEADLVRSLQRRVAALGIGLVTGARVVQVESGTECARIEYEHQGSLATATAQIVAQAAGGSGSMPDPGRTTARDYGQSALTAIVECERAQAACAYERFTGKGPIGLLPYAGRHALIWTVPQDEAATLLALDDAGFCRTLQERFGERLGAVRLAGPRAAFALQLRFAHRIAGNRHALIGNAAQTLHPVAGQGFNIGLRDAFELARAAADARRHDQPLLMGLDRYRASRRADRAGGTLFTDVLVRMFSNDDPVLAAARSAGLLLFDASGPVKRFLMRRMIFGART